MELYKSFFYKQWAPLTGGILIGYINTLMFAIDSPWSVFMGVRNWGLHAFAFAGVGDATLLSPLEHTTSVMNIGFLLGAFSATLLAKEFAIRVPSLREAIKGIIGGSMMGIGAVFSRGCTIGGFYSSIASMSASGLFMMLGLIIGVMAGHKYLMWEKRGTSGRSGGGTNFAIPTAVQIPLGAIVLVSAIILIPYYYDSLHYDKLGIIFLMAAVIGIVNRQSRFCIVRCFRNPLMGGDGGMTKAVIVSFVVVIAGFSVLKFAGIKDVADNINPSFWVPALMGGIIFGIGMSVAGGCASGSLWRSAEGKLKLVLAVIGFALASAGTHLILKMVFNYSYIRRVFLPDAVGGWSYALALVTAVMVVWYLIISWNEKTETLVMK